MSLKDSPVGVKPGSPTPGSFCFPPCPPPRVGSKRPDPWTSCWSSRGQVDSVNKVGCPARVLQPDASALRLWFPSTKECGQPVLECLTVVCVCVCLCMLPCPQLSCLCRGGSQTAYGLHLRMLCLLTTRKRCLVWQQCSSLHASGAILLAPGSGQFCPWAPVTTFWHRPSLEPAEELQGA